MSRREFRTLKGYQLRDRPSLTLAMEDYLEMICRGCGEEGRVHINHLAEQLHVRPSSASKMARNLKSLGYVDYEPYGAVTLTAKGKAEGEYLLYRHDLLHRFLSLVNDGEDVLEEVERLEHFFSRRTIENLARAVDRWEKEGKTGMD